MPERLQRLIDTKLELQNVRNRFEIMQNRYVIMFLTAPVWGTAAQKWTAQGDDVLHVNFLVSVAVMLFGAVGYAFYWYKHRHVKDLTGVPIEYLDSETRRKLEESAKSVPRVTDTPMERKGDRRSPEHHPGQRSGDR